MRATPESSATDFRKVIPRAKLQPINIMTMNSKFLAAILVVAAAIGLVAGLIFFSARVDRRLCRR